KKVRELVGAALPRAILDPLPAELKERERLPHRSDALWAVHRPRSLEEAETGRARLAFEELLILQIGIAARRRERESEIAPSLGVSCALLTSSSTKRERDVAPSANVLVGTHALIQEGFELQELAVAVVDEQHRFGVAQRRALAEGRSPHVLHMTATPIPRTLALTVYGDLAVSEIAKPP